MDAEVERVDIRVREQGLWFTDPRVGGVMGSGSDQASALQTWVNLAETATNVHCVALMPAGQVIFASGTGVVLDSSKSIHVVRMAGGENNESGSVIRVTSDIGAGNYVFKTQGSAPFEFRNIGISGAFTASMGSRPAKMGGIWVTTRAKFNNVVVQKLGDGLRLNYHTEMVSCQIRGNGSAAARPIPSRRSRSSSARGGAAPGRSPQATRPV
jgi:hypothetical protein